MLDHSRLSWLLALSCAALVSCSRTGLYEGTLASSGGPSAVDDDDDDEEPADPGPDPEPEPERLPHLPELTVVARLTNGSVDTLTLNAPLLEDKGPFEVITGAYYGSEYEPGGARLAALTDEMVFILDEWPPVAQPLAGTEGAQSITWLAVGRLLVTMPDGVTLHDLVKGTSERVFGGAPGDEPYWCRPSPDARWLACGVFSSKTGLHSVRIVDLEETPRSTRPVVTFPVGTVLAWFDWAPDSQHLAYATARDGVWHEALSVSTKDGSDLTPTSFTLPVDELGSIPDFQWAPDGKSLFFFQQQLVSLEGGEIFEDLYWVDMSQQLPQPPVPLTDFAERHWASPGWWSPTGGELAFGADFGGSTYHSSLFVTRIGGDPLKSVLQYSFDVSLLKIEWAPAGDALYFTGWNASLIEGLYKSDLAGSFEQISQPGADVRGVFVSPLSGCVAYSQFEPQPALVVVDEKSGKHESVGDPEANNPDWSGTFDSSRASWVSDSSGLRGLLFLSQDSIGRGTLAFAQVTNCTPTRVETLIPPDDARSIEGYRSSTEPPIERRR